MSARVVRGNDVMPQVGLQYWGSSYMEDLLSVLVPMEPSNLSVEHFKVVLSFVVD